MISSTITQRGQTTLPKKIREAFGLDAGKKLIYEIKEDSFVVRPHPGAMASFGALKNLGNDVDISVEQAIDKAKSEWADHAAHEGLKR